MGNGIAVVPDAGLEPCRFGRLELDAASNAPRVLPVPVDLGIQAQGIDEHALIIAEFARRQVPLRAER